ncbi:inner membrane protein [Oesophagostomum dentatum]|uniref:Inner membrane protein n=1 Tax=Oesophagostomum dentatum TaxID=61180 RepID=A0A0B1SGJ0_OESDE|nr:inner membrane protein [Oesophagostomum dentatum]
MSQRLVAKQSMYKKELDDFRARIEDARKEGNNLLQQQIFLEQRDFLRSKDIRLGRQFFILLANGAVFATQFFAIRKMVEVNYPGLSTGGTAWFPDLTVTDPYYLLPLISAVTMGLVTRKVGIEMGTSADQMTPMMRLGMQYALPVVIFAVSSQFATGLCVYWCASNFVSLIYAGAFRTEAIRKMLNIPPLVKPPKSKKPKNTFKELMASYKANKSIPPTFAQLKEQDLQQFKKAGRGKPIVKS